MLSTHARRTAVLHVRVTATEREAIIARATRAGKSVSDYVRGAAMYYAAQPVNHASPKAGVGDTVKFPPPRFLSSADGKAGA